jgi:hypothetical protein
MAKGYNILFFCLSMLFVVNTASATEKPTKLYVYGFSASFNDSTIYFTDIMELDSAWINSKTKFLYGRNVYSSQLKDYLQANGVDTPTCIISYATTRKKAEKKYMKLRSKYTSKKQGNYIIKYITTTDFRFNAVTAEGDAGVTTATSKAAEKSEKKALKQKKKLQKATNKEKKKEVKSI